MRRLEEELAELEASVVELKRAIAAPLLELAATVLLVVTSWRAWLLIAFALACLGLAGLVLYSIVDAWT